MRGPPGDVRILHVDDEPDFAEMTATFLERSDAQFTVETASSAADGLDRLTDTAFDCVVSDYDMPGRNGIEFLETVREEHPDLPFVLHTGKGSEEVASDAISAGVTDYLQKEGGTDQYTVLANRVRNAVEGYRSRQALAERQAELERKDRAMDAAPVGITIAGPSGDDNPLGYVNDRFTEVTGYSEKEALGSNCRFLQGERTSPEQVARMREAIDDEEPVTVELRNYRKDGTEFWNRVSIAPVPGNGSEVTNYVGFQQDVTEERERQEQLETVEEYRRDVYRITADIGMTPEEKIQRLVALGCEFLDLENGHIVEVDRGTAHHEVHFAAGSDLVEAGTVSDLSETFCRLTIEADDILAIANAPEDGYADDPAYETWRISCYVGAKLVVDDELFGTLCFADRDGNAALTGPEKAVVDLMARWISHALERKRARRERERVFDRMTDGVFALDSEWHLQYANDRGRDLLGTMLAEPKAREELAGTQIWDAIPGIEGTRFHEECREAMRTQQQVSFQSYYEPLDRWFDVRAYPDEAGLSVYFRDVTEERQRESRIEAHKRILQEIYDAIADTDHSFESRVDRLIGIGQRVTGTEYGSLSRVHGDEYTFEVVRAPEGTIQAGDVVDLHATHCERAIRTEETLVLSDIAAEAPELVEKTGNAEWDVSCYVGTPVTLAGEVYGTFCVYDTEPRREPFSEWEVAIVDIIGKWIGYELTRERTATRLREQNDRLERFASIVSHDLRNPLRVADGRLELARERHDSEHLDAIDRALSRMDGLIDDLLTVAREGERVREPEPVALGDLVETCWQNVATAEAELVVECDRTVQSDASRLQQVFENLIRNAIEHGGDDVTIAVGELDDGFYVEDDGARIPDADREDVFEAGYSTSAEGTGFGLAIVKRVVEAHGWSIRVSDSPERETRFEITGVEFTDE
ncbi:hypothetical protein BRC93_12270 [Halobacteriales archaeon QS_5_70_15]|nr:MAG: hypothetical protein BRC93_12270 [Halobacteriales archaeon QS_5_70_15]